MRILIGYDDSVPLEKTLLDLDRAGLPSGTEAVILSVATAWGHDPFPRGGGKRDRPGPPPSRQLRKHMDRAMKETRALADSGKRRLRERFPAWKIQAEAAIDDAAEALLAKAEAWNADLVAVGPGRSAIRRLFLGSVSQKVLGYARTSVRITRAGGEGKHRAPRILIGVDGSAGSLGAVSEVCGRSWPENTKVRLVSVVDSRLPLSVLSVRAAPREGSAGSPIADRDWLEGKLEAAAERISAAGLDAEPVILAGEPRRALLEQARDWRAQSVFLGSRGLNSVERFFIGSVSSGIAMQAPCSVEVVKAKRKRKS